MRFLKLRSLYLHSFGFFLFLFIVFYFCNDFRFQYTGHTSLAILVTPSFLERSKWQDAVVQGTAVQGISKLVCCRKTSAKLKPQHLFHQESHLKKKNQDFLERISRDLATVCLKCALKATEHVWSTNRCVLLTSFQLNFLFTQF